ncbi:MAG: PQQ-binding-like beta-propeller repeat protein [Vicinamibacterales bacterium]
MAGADRTADASIHALDRLTGKELWRHPAGRGVNGPIAGGGGRAYAARFEGQLLSLDVGSGDLRWAVDLKISGMEGPAAGGGRVFAGTVDGVLHGLNAETGREEWGVNLGAPVSTTVTVSTADLYVGTADGAVHRVDAKPGHGARFTEAGSKAETRRCSGENRGFSAGSSRRSVGRLSRRRLTRSRARQRPLACRGGQKLDDEPNLCVG